MKKLVSILLALVMAVSFSTFTAYAEDVEINSNDIAGLNLDYTAFDNLITLINELDKAPYTDESLEALNNALVDRDSFISQKEIDDAIEDISTAFSNLERKQVNIVFTTVDSNENYTDEESTHLYGDVVDFEVKDTDEIAYKWMLSNDDGDKKLDAQGNNISIITTQDTNLVAFTDVAPEIKEQTKQVKFLSINGKVIDIINTTDVDNITLPDAPAVPFYVFVEWVKVDDLTYRASYKVNPRTDDHKFTITVIDSTCDTYGYTIFECACGERYTTDYTRPIGHNYDNVSEYCLNGCGTLNPNIEEYSETEEGGSIVTPQEPTTQPTPSVEPSFDNSGYSDVVIMP